jgi:oligopeptide/dipeptide ABC transporter ATP-binding protein
MERKRERQVLAGEITSPVNLKPGCRFAGRCPKAMPICAGTQPQWREVAPAHFVACHLFNPDVN